jgi:hypothetical protein
VSHMEEERKVHKVLDRKPEGERPLERPRYRWEDWIRMDLGEIGWVVYRGSNWPSTGTSSGL